MKTIAATLVFFIFLSVMPGRVQAQTCKDWQEQIDEMEKRLEKIEGMKLNYDDFFSLMDNPSSVDGGIPEEIATQEHRINWIEQKIAGGDRSAETAAELKSARTRLELLNLRNNPANSKAVLLKDPRYLEQQRNLKNLSSEQTELKMEVAKVGLNMQNNNCPPRTKKPSDDLDEDDLGKIETETGWPGNWKWVDPTGKIIYRMALTGSGSSLSGNVKGQMINDPFTYVVNGCRETVANKVVCNFTGVYENAEGYTDVKGTVEMTLSSNNIQSRWQESQKPTIRWKGTPPKEKIPMRDPSYFNIPFKKE